MARPHLIAVRGQFLKLDGTPETGSLEFQSRGYILYSHDSISIVPSRIVAPLDEDGIVDVLVPATNDPAWVPSGWVYTLAIKLSQDYSVYKVMVPFDSPNEEISLAELIPAEGAVVTPPTGNYAPLVHNHTAANIVSGTIAMARLPVGTTHETLAYGDHTHPGLGGDIDLTDVTGLVAALNAKANTVHTHAISDISNLQTSIDAKANVSHTHAIADTTNLQSTLNGKANTSHTHTIAQVTNLQTTLDGKSNTDHVHANYATVSALTDGLALKLDKSIATTKGDIFVATGDSTLVRVGVGPDGQVLTAASEQATGVKWSTPSSGGGGSQMVVKRAIVSSGNIVPQTAVGWEALTGGPVLSIPAVVGDYVSLEIMSFLFRPIDSLLDLAVQTSSGLVRFSSSGTSTAATEGDPGFYLQPSTFRTAGVVFDFVVQAADLESGNVSVVFATKGNGTGTVYASADYPLRWRLINYGPVNVS